MVTIKKVILYILIVSAVSCYYTGVRSEYGLPRRKIKPLPENTDYSKIDTNALYVPYAYYFKNTITREAIEFYKEKDDTYPYIGFLKFYSKGKLGLFIIPKADTLHMQRCFFDPKKAKMGYYHIEGEKIRTKISIIGDATLYISNKKGRIYGDTIELSSKNYYYQIYIKKKIPIQLLENWKPDW